MDKNNQMWVQKEAYLLANHDPWLLWRLQALRAGQVPPLLNGKIPPDLAGLTFGKKEKDYDIEPLMKQAKRIRSHERGLIPKFFVILLTGALLIGGFGFYLYTTHGVRFKVPMLNSLLPKNEQTYEIWYK